MDRKIKIIVVDDLKSTRDGIKAYLQSEGMEIIGEAEHGKQLLELLTVNKLVPDVILLDIEMPEMDGIETLVRVKEFDPNLKVIMLTLYKNNDLVNDLKAKGANCYFDKGIGIDVITEAIRKIVRDQAYSNIPKKLKSMFTKVEIEILLLMKDGKTSSEIAAIRGKSVKSIESHRKKMYEKAGAANASDFSSFCTKHGLYFLGR